jgi:hypothetical protein
VLPLSAPAKCGSGLLSMWLAEAVCEPVTVASLRDIDEFVELNQSPKRAESALQPATANPINEMATSCGQTAGRGNARMVTHSYAIQGQANKLRCGKQGFKRQQIFWNNWLCVFGATAPSLAPAIAAQIVRR